MRHTYLFNFYLSKITCKRSEVNTKLNHLLTLMNNGKTFSSLDDIACSYQCSEQFQFLPGHWQAKRYWISWDLKTYEKIILITSGIVWGLKLKIKKWWNVGLLIPTLNKIIRNQCTDFVVITNNLISVHGAPL